MIDGPQQRGERGPTGDHGQDGKVGATGPQGAGAPRYALVGYLIMFVFFVGALYYAYEADHHAQNAILVNCNFGNKNREVIRLILSDANQRTQTSKQRSPEQKRASAQFYNAQLQRLKPFDCSRLSE